MTVSQTAPYGEWPSPVSAALATEGMTAGQVAAPRYVDFVGAEVWWVEPRPDEDGRQVLMRRRADGTVGPALAGSWNVRSRVIEYGGRPWAAVHGERGVLAVFVNVADQRLYACEVDVAGAQPRPLTPVSPVGGGLRWSEPEIDPDRAEVRCVLEEFTGPGPAQVRRVIAAVPLDGSAAGDRSAIREMSDDRHRFVSGPRFSPDGTRAAWLAWDHPYLPWDGAELIVAKLGDDGVLHRIRTLAGGPADPIAQVDWAPDGSLLIASARTGWWNLYRIDYANAATVPLHPAEREFAGPQRLGLRWFAPLPDGRIAVLHGVGAQRPALLDPATGELADLPGDRSEWLPYLAVAGTRLVGVAASPRTPYEVVEVDTGTGQTRVIGGAHPDTTRLDFLTGPTDRVFTGTGGARIHAYLYPPNNPEVTAPAGELPPYVVWAHGGPTLRATAARNLEIAFFTSRGIGVVDVNYGGSPGYGRDYLDRLRGQWGVLDVEDCASVARALVDEGLAAPGRIAIRGVSAGGFTAAASLITTDVYACATLLCPLLDLAAIASGQTHDFESHYLDTLIGPPSEVPDRYRDRSPAAHPSRITAPFLLLQGLDDVICPPDQAERFLAGLAGTGVRYAHRTFPGEGHGFRRKATMITSLEAELSLYAQVFGFNPPAIPTLALPT